MSALVAEALSFAYPDGPPALDAVDLAVGSGELVFVIGPNGSGKSTLLKLFGGLLRPDRGHARLDGRALVGLRPRARARRIAFVPQGLAALPPVEVETFVLGGRYAHFGLFGRTERRDWDAVRRAIDEADVGAFRGRFLNELSGGQCQRVLVARAFAQQADVLLFDEPTAALDPEHQIRIYDLIEGAARGGKTVLVATHELWLAGRYAARVVLLDRGRVVADGPPRAVLSRTVLEPVYGPYLAYREAPGGGAGPLVVPWPVGEAPAPPRGAEPSAGSSARRPGV